MKTRRRIRRRVARRAPKVRRCACGGARDRAKDRIGEAGGLMIGGAKDPAEAKADARASHALASGPLAAPPVRRQCAACTAEEMAQRSPAAGVVAPGAAPGRASKAAETAVSALGPGRPMARAERAYFEPRFGADFSDVRIHDGPAADKANRAINARAFTLGNDVSFARGERQPGTEKGRHLLAHELAHVVGEKRAAQREVKRVWKPDTGWRYTPPKSVTRSIKEIQAVVGTTPDGIYGNNTREAVRKYQIKLKTKGLFAGSANGKWNGATDVAHVDHSTGNKSEDYNCSGLAFKTFQPVGKRGTEAILVKMTQLAGCSNKCSPRQYKFWFWTYDVSLTNTNTGRTTPTRRDFHIVGGQTDGDGKGPSTVVSKNGSRPVKGPAAPMSWKPVSEWARTNDRHDTPSRHFWKNRKNMKQACFCAKSLP